MQSLRDRLVTLVSFHSPLEAALLKGRLEEIGVKVSLTNDSLVNMNPLLSNAVGGVKLQVFESDFERAGALLKDLLVETAPGDDVDDTFNDQAAATSSLDDEKDDNEDEVAPLNQREQDADGALNSALVGLFFVPLQFHTAWLLLKVFFSDDPLRPGKRGRAVVAGLILIPFVALALWFAGRALSSR